MPSHIVRRRRGLHRVSAVVIAVLAAVALVAPSAGAAAAVTIPLDPPEVELSLRAQTVGHLPVASPPASGGETISPHHHQWGGTSRLLLPHLFDGSAMTVSLELAPSPTGVPTRTYSSTSAVPADQLAVTNLGPGPFTGVTQWEVTMPAYDAANPTFGRLVFSGLTTTAGAGFTVVDPFRHHYEFVSSGGMLQYIAPQVVARAQVPCALSSASRCAATAVAAGSDLGLTVPASSRLTIGLGNLTGAALALQALDANGAPTAAAPIPLPGARVTAGGSGLNVTVPRDVRAGAYRLTVVHGADVVIYGTDTMNRIVVTTIELNVTNAGLRSNTGWAEGGDSTAAGSPLVALGAGMVLLAGAGAALVLRPRRRAVSAE